MPARDLHLVTPRGPAGLVHVGRGEVPEGLPFATDALDVPVNAWSLHSGADVLRTGITTLGQRADIVLFHDFPRRLERFVRTLDGQSEVKVLTQRPIQL